MATPPGQALQRVCSHCSTLAVTPERSCPWCGRSYVRRSTLPYFALLALLQTVLTIGALVLVLTQVGEQLETELDDQVNAVQTDVERQFEDLDGRVRDELRRELDQRLPVPPTAP